MKDSPKKTLKKKAKKISIDSKGNKSSSLSIKFGKSIFQTIDSLFSSFAVTLFTVSLLIILLVLIVYDISTKNEITRIAIKQSLPKVHFHEYPLLKDPIVPSLSAESALILDDSSKIIIFEKNPRLRFSMASTTKIMTALVALEYFKLDDVILIKTKINEGAVVGFEAGEAFLFEDVIHGLLLPSGNDAAYALAENYPGGLVAFVNRMNEKAKELALTYTHYSDPSGLDDDGNYMTAIDLARLASVALKNETFSRIVATKKHVLISMDGIKKYTVFNLNKLLGEEGIVGVKTGFTEGAGEVLVTAKVENNRTFIIVVMKSKDRFADTRTLVQLISNNITFINFKKNISPK